MLIVGVIAVNKVIISKIPFNIENPYNKIDENIWKIGNSFFNSKAKKTARISLLSEGVF